MVKWEQLPVDIILLMFGKYLSVKDILNLRATNRLFRSIAQIRSLWYTIMHVRVLEKNIPIPGLANRPIDSLSAGDLEHFTRNALQLRRNWSAPAPVVTQQIYLPGSESPSRNVSLVFIYGRGHHWLLSVDVAVGPPQLQFTVKCWDVGVTPPAFVARRQLTVFSGLAVNTDHKSLALMAVQCPHTEIWNINPSATDPDSAFVTLESFRTRVGEICAFSGSRILMGEVGSRYVLWDLQNPDRDIELQNPISSQREKVLTAIVTEDVAVLFRIPTMEIYPVSSLGSTAGAGTVVYPVDQHNWPWRIDSIKVVEQPSWPEPPGGHHVALDVLVRFSSWYPWPTNMLHHYTLRPNKSYVPSSGVDPNNLPYLASPQSVQVYVSPVRLFSPSPMALGRYGTALWIDSHTEDYFGDSGFGQRLAGRILLNGDIDDDAVGSPAQPSGSSEMASIVFCVRERDDWIRLAMDEKEGRIAAGSVNGGSTLLEYSRR